MMLFSAIDALLRVGVGSPGTGGHGLCRFSVGGQPWVAAGTEVMLSFGPRPPGRDTVVLCPFSDLGGKLATDYALAIQAAPSVEVDMAALRAWLGSAHLPGSLCPECRGGRVVCPRCAGAGLMPSPCPECGHVRYAECGTCAGSGAVTCESCGGLGVVSIHRSPMWPGMVFGVPVNRELLARATLLFPAGGRVGLGVVRALGTVFLRRPEMTVAVAGLTGTRPDVPVWAVC